MVSILDRYILSRYIKIVIFSEFAFVAIFLIVDIFDKMDKFIDRDASMGILLAFYFYQLPYIITLVLPVALLISCFFSLGTMAKHFELISMKDSGKSLLRILLHVFVFGLILSALMIWMTGELVPQMNRIAKQIEEEKIIGKQPIDLLNRNSFSFIGDNNLFYWASHFDGRKKKLTMLEVMRIVDGKLSEIIIADKALWQDGEWLLSNGYHRVISDEGEEYYEFEEKTFPKLNVTPEDLGKPSRARDEMSISELADHMSKLARLGRPAVKEKVDYYIRFAFPFSNFIMIFLGAPLSASYRKSGSWMGFIISILICFIFFAFVRFLQTLGYTGRITPLTAAWGTNLAFFFAGGLFILRENRK